MLVNTAPGGLELNFLYDNAGSLCLYHTGCLMRHKNLNVFQLREVSMAYNNCESDKKWVDMINTSQYNRWSHMLEYLQQLDTCKYVVSLILQKLTLYYCVYLYLQKFLFMITFVPPLP